MPARPRYPRGVTRVRTARLPCRLQGGDSHRPRRMRPGNVLRIPGSGSGGTAIRRALGDARPAASQAHKDHFVARS